jgi:hypothetical protein
MLRFKSWGQARRFLSTNSRIHSHFQLRRHLITATEYRLLRVEAFRGWQEAPVSPFTHDVATKCAMTHNPFNNLTAPHCD